MEITITERDALKQELSDCKNFFLAIGDEIRQQIVLFMLASPNRENRAVDIAQQLYISRPNISHHLQILKDAGIVVSRKSGKFIYYSLYPNSEILDKVIHLMDTVKHYSDSLEDNL